MSKTITQDEFDTLVDQAAEALNQGHELPVTLRALMDDLDVEICEPWKYGDIIRTASGGWFARRESNWVVITSSESPGTIEDDDVDKMIANGEAEVWQP